MAELLSFLITFRSGNYTVIQAPSLHVATREAAQFGGDLNDIEEIPNVPEDWHEQEEQLLHTLG